MRFTELNLHPDLERGLNEAGYITCMPVQEQVLQHAFSGQDLYVQSQTGTGKTAAFLIVIFQRLLSEAMLGGKKAIIMVPTRELAVQVEEEAKLLGKYLPFKTGSFYGGVGYTQQTKSLRENVQIMVGTPGRVLDLNQGGQMNLMEIAFLVLDEADRMFDMGFYPDLRKLIRAVPPADRRQTMLFSATLNAWVKNLAWEYTRNPFEIAIEPETVTVEEVEQVLYHVSSADKMKLLLGILKRENPESALIFCNTKRYAEIVAKRLRLNGLECEFIMGDLPQSKRLRIIEDIKAGKLHFLVATDVAARGLDIEGLAMVINYDLPNETENYVHRIGRTARAGKTGKAVTLASEQDVYELPGIERYIGRKIPSETATAELLAADKSEGKRIHTDFYEESGGGKDRSREERRGRDTRRKDHEPGREREKHRDAKGQTREKKRADQNRNVKLSELSLEERMAYYKQKYDKSGASQNRYADEERAAPNERKSQSGKESGRGARRRDNEGSRKRDHAAHVNKAAAGEGRSKAAEANAAAASGQPGRKNRNRRRGKGRQAEAVQTAANPTAAEPGAAQEPAKKGFFSRLLGIFKKGD
ncbi:MAG: DEAD/DEAH box helicase [Treponema sp.]|jgi:ATP-dependent RNA helicase RhlB|nr:DEAD/DEAH box helicase [Treponema sp.]